MLFSLIAVLVLMVVAFYALWMAATGRVNGNEGAELSAGGRLMLLGIAVVTLGIAYAMYHPRRDEAQIAEAPAMPSAPPDSRGTPETPVAASKPAVVETAAAATDSPAPTPAVEEPKAVAAKAPLAEDDKGVLSESAMRLEAAARERFKPSAALPETMKAEVVKAQMPQMEAAPQAKPVAAPEPAMAPRSRPMKTTTARPRTYSTHGPLLVHVHNRLWDDQQAEQLTLSIEGRPVADIELDQDRPAVAVAVTLPRPGLLHYRLEGHSDDSLGSQLAGEGCIRVSDDAHFVVRRKAGSQKLFLEAMQVAR